MIFVRNFALPDFHAKSAPGDNCMHSTYDEDPLILQHFSFKQIRICSPLCQTVLISTKFLFHLDIDKELAREAIVQPIIASTWRPGPWQGYQSFQQIIHKSVLRLLQILRIIGESMKEYQKVRKSPSNYCIG